MPTVSAPLTAAMMSELLCALFDQACRDQAVKSAPAVMAVLMRILCMVMSRMVGNLVRFGSIAKQLLR